MAHYKEINRTSDLFVQGSLDSLLPSTSIARMIWAGLAPFNFSLFDELHTNDDVGRPALSPRSLVAVWILALLRDDTSSVRLARLCETDIEYRWLLGGQSVEKTCLCDFRKQHGPLLSQLGSQILTALGHQRLLPGERVGIDGTVVRAASSKHAVRSREGLQKQARRLEEILKKKLSRIDMDDDFVEIHDLEQRLAGIEETLSYMQTRVKRNKRKREHVTVSEPSARLLRQKEGSYAPGYNIQSVVDLDTGVIIHADVNLGGSDSAQLQPQLEQAQAVLDEVTPESSCSIQSVVADGCYHDAKQLNALERKGVACFVPDVRNSNSVNHSLGQEYCANAFIHDPTSNTVYCPQGHALKRVRYSGTHSSVTYMAHANDCAACPAKPYCCPHAKGGRQVNIPLYTEVLNNVVQRVDSPQGQWMQRARSISCEGVFARLKDQLHWKRCRLWGEQGVRAELSWRQLAHNLMILMNVWKPMVMKPA